MTTHGTRPLYASPYEVTRIYDELIQEYDHQGNSSETSDIRTAAFGRAMVRVSAMDEVREATMSAIQLRIDRGVSNHPSQLASHTQRAVQKQLWERQDTTYYPFPHDDEGIWVPQLEEMFTDPSIHFDHMTRSREFSWFVGFFNLVSNKYQRYSGIGAFSKAMEHELPELPTYLDIGASQNHGLKALAHNEKFDTVTVRKSEDGDIDYELTERFNQAMNHPRRLGPSRGIDEYTERNFPGVTAWAESCSFYPSELLNPKLLERYRQLSALILDNVDLVAANASLPGMRFNGRLSYTIGLLFTVLDQQQPRTGKAMIENVIDNTDRYVFAQDFAEVSPNDPFDIRCVGDWFSAPYTYRLFGLDMHDQELGFQEVLRWKEPRCRTAVFGNSRLATEMKERLMA